MSVFEFAFGLGAVVFGLALTEMFMRLQQLVFAGRRVKWAAEPLLAAATTYMIIVIVWLGTWRQRDATQFSVGQVAFLVAFNIPLIMAALGALPRTPDEGQVDMADYYYRVRRYLLGLILLSATASLPFRLIGAADTSAVAVVLGFYLLNLIPYVILLFTQRRWLHHLLLSLVLVGLVAASAGQTITG